MKSKADSAVLKQSDQRDSAVKRRFSWPLSRENEALSQTSSAVPTASGAVNQMVKDINHLNIKDPVDRSSLSHALSKTAELRQTDQDPCVYRGLLNPGMTCYLNAVLQVLFMTPDFRLNVMRASDTSEELESALKDLFEELSERDRRHSVSARGVIRALGIDRVYEQQDAVEYFQEILERVGSSLSEVFRGTMRNIRKCSEGHESHDDSSFKSLQIALNSRDGPCTLEDGVRSYLASTKLVGDDQMYCERCDGKSDTVWSCKVLEYPTILALHLKRFVYNSWWCRFEKNDCGMDVPLGLSLQEQEYSLYAVINHSGSRYGGHYTADIRADHTWYCFNDSRVTETDESKLKGSSEAYLLLYQKNVAEVKLNQKVKKD